MTLSNFFSASAAEQASAVLSGKLANRELQDRVGGPNETEPIPFPGSVLCLPFQVAYPPQVHSSAPISFTLGLGADQLLAGAQKPPGELSDPIAW